MASPETDVVLRAQIISEMKKFTNLVVTGASFEKLQEAREYIKRLIDQLGNKEKRPAQ